MAEKLTLEEDKGKNPHLSLILADIENRKVWAERDGQILKRRLCERKRARTRPYPKAPNPIEPIVDDVVRGKTTEEISMVVNAPLFAHAIALEKIEAKDLSTIEVAFDTYVRHFLRAQPLIEEAMDTKNSRGFTIIKITRKEDERHGELPCIEIRDPRDVIVPSATRQIEKARRITDVYRLDPDEFRALAKQKDWENIDAVLETISEDRDESQADTGLKDALGETAHLVGVTTAGKGSDTVVIWEHWHYATDWDVEQDGSGQIVKGQKCCTIFCPEEPDKICASYPWREDDVPEPLSREEAVLEIVRAATAGEQPVLTRMVRGRERPWPFIQPRYENRSRFFHDSRGIGHLCMDNQISATAIQRAKMVLMDYAQNPLLTGESRPSTNITLEPGSFLPDGMSFVNMPAIPPQFDFDIEGHRRTAGRRAHAGAQTEMSDQMSTTRKVQKTAEEVRTESIRGATLSSADVDRFNLPWAEVYMQLWEDLGRMRKPLPMIVNGTYRGEASVDLYGKKILLVPASNAKTLNPDQQFGRAQQAWNFAQTFLPLGVTLDPQKACTDILSHWDPQIVDRWLPDPEQGQLPVYKILEQLSLKMQEIDARGTQMMDLLQKTSKLAMETSDKTGGAQPVTAGA